MINRRSTRIQDHRKSAEVFFPAHFNEDAACSDTPTSSIESELSSAAESAQLLKVLARRSKEIATFVQAPVGILLVDKNGRCLQTNQKLCDIVGYSEEELLGRDYLNLTHPDDREIVSAETQRILNGEIPTYSLELRYLHKNGDVVWVNLNVSLVRNPDTTPDYFVTIVEKIDKRRQTEKILRDSEEQLRNFVRDSPMALAMFDREMRYLQVSNQWLEDFQLIGQDLHGRSHYEIFPDIPERWKIVHRRGLAGETISSDEDLFKRSDSSTYLLRWEVRPWYDGTGNVGGLIFFSEDINKYKPVNDALRVAAVAFDSSEAMLITDANTVIL